MKKHPSSKTVEKKAADSKQKRLQKEAAALRGNILKRKEQAEARQRYSTTEKLSSLKEQ